MSAYWHRWLAGQFARPRGIAGHLLLGPWLDRIGGAMNRLVLDRLDIGPNDDVLEIGFGGGGLLAAILAATAGKVFGVDISQAMVGRARRRFRREVESGRLSLSTGSADSLPLASSAVDKACSVASIHFWPDPEAALTELARVLRPGGRLAICFEPPEELRKWPGHRHGFRLWEEGEVAALMRSAGFGGIETAWGSGRKPDRFLCLSGERQDANAGPKDS